ncbi:MAG: HEPN domain-containing protein, partial [Euryarchaeota archaeon]|nr:HEPN domain-containing protein [Euryarchaeota archaeon]
MPRRTRDWFNQAQRDLEHSKMDLMEEFYEWSCFSAQQA